MHRFTLFLIVALVAFIVLASVSSTRAATYTTTVTTRAQIVSAIGTLITGDRLNLVAAAPVVVGTTIVISVPGIEINGLWLRAQDSVERLFVVNVTAPNVNITGFNITGNRDTTITVKGCLLMVKASGFRLVNGYVMNASKNGITVGYGAEEIGLLPNITSGYIANIFGRNNERDSVSLTGHGNYDNFVTNVVIAGVRQYHDSMGRGAVEVSDGTSNILVSDIYAENSLYAIDVQDHGFAGQSNTYITIMNVTVRNCTYLIRTSNSEDFGHRGLWLSNLTGTAWPVASYGLSVTNTRDVTVTDLVTSGAPVAVGITNCKYVNVYRATDSAATEACIVVTDSRYVNVGGITCAGAKPFMRFTDTNHIAGYAPLTGSATGKIKLDNCDDYTFAYPASLIVVV